jgi:hypothetical protein
VTDNQPAEFLTVPGRLIPRVVRRWADRVIRTAVDGIEAWESAHDCWGEEEVSEG